RGAFAHFEGAGAVVIRRPRPFAGRQRPAVVGRPAPVGPMPLPGRRITTTAGCSAGLLYGVTIAATMLVPRRYMKSQLSG
ncbi:hypothetical protein, partial [Arthrobacter sp. 260]|uniref:hypothetical protein n=1 Tax=Arthrobacter sp. 260 TaxID=2735314 RepID=UPI001C1071E6